MLISQPLMLNLIIWIPFLAAAIIGFWPGKPSAARLRVGAGGVALVIFVLSIVWAFSINSGISGFQSETIVPWLPKIGFSYHLGVDGISLPLVLLNALVMVLVLYASSTNIPRPQLYYSLLLLIEGGVNGAFLAQDLLLFFLFYEVELVPLYLLIGIWGGERRGYAATKFLIYTAVSGALVFISFIGVVALSGADSFDYNPTLSAQLPLAQQSLLLAVVLVAFAIKVPIVPLHTWLPDAHVEASTPVSMILAGVLLKLGTYGLLRFGLGLFPDAWHLFAPWLAALAVVSTLYGSLNAIVQQDMKKLVAYSSIGHMGYILLALAAGTPLSLLGAVYQMVSHGLISALLFLVVGFVYSRTGTRDLQVLQGLLTPERGLPLVGTLMILGVMASSGLPGMMGFVAEFMIFRGSFLSFPRMTLLCMVGTGLTSVYFLLLVNRAFFGRLQPAFARMERVQRWEHLPGLVLALLIVLFGIQPQWLVGWSEVAVNTLSQSLPS